MVVGVNRFTEAEPSPLTAGDGGILVVDPAVEAEQIARLRAWRAARDPAAVAAALAALARRRRGRRQHHAGLDRRREGRRHHRRMGQRDARGLRRVPRPDRRRQGGRTPAAAGLAEVRAAVEATSARIGRRIKFLVGKPGLDGHSNGAEQIAVRARDSGMEVLYEGIRLTPAQIVNAALEESVHVVGLSILSGSHLPLVTEVMERMRAAGLDDIPVVVGGIIPDADAEALKAAGVARVYTPKDFELNRIMLDIVALADDAARAAA